MGVLIRLPLAAAVAGRTVEKTTGKVLSCDVQIYCRGSRTRCATLSRTEDGTFSFEDLEPGVHDLKAVSESGLVGFKVHRRVGGGAYRTDAFYRIGNANT